LTSDTPSPPSRSERVRLFLRFEGLDNADDGNVVPAGLLWRLGSSGRAFEAAAANPSCDIVVPAQAAQLKTFSKAQCHKTRGKLLKNLTTTTT